MSHADKLFKETCRDILENGTNTKNQKVRPHILSQQWMKFFGFIRRSLID